MEENVNPTLARLSSTLDAPHPDASWWADVARLTDQLREEAEIAFSLGDYPAEMRERASRLNDKADRLRADIMSLRRFAADAAPDRSRVESVKERAHQVLREWDRQFRRVTTFIGDANWRDLGVAG
jgi:hypothetical protein